MSKNYDELGKKIVEKLGGPENITKIYHCATRLRTELKNLDIVDLEEIKKINGVLGAVSSVGGIQVIIGNDVTKVFNVITKKYNLGTSNDSAEKIESNKQNIFSKLLNVLSAIMGPAIPLIMCSGLISALLVISTRFGLNPESSTYTIINMVGNAALYFLPILLAYTSAKKFGTDIMISIFLGGIMISPVLIGLTEVGSYVDLFGLPLRTVNYTSTLIPIILTI